jgi:hypothetical protein
MVSEATNLNEILGLSERLSVADQLKLISQLSERLRGKVTQESKPVDMLSLAGLGAELWQKIDVEGYIEQERASWES